MRILQWQITSPTDPDKKPVRYGLYDDLLAHWQSLLPHVEKSMENKNVWYLLDTYPDVVFGWQIFKIKEHIYILWLEKMNGF